MMETRDKLDRTRSLYLKPETSTNSQTSRSTIITQRYAQRSFQLQTIVESEIGTTDQTHCRETIIAASIDIERTTDQGGN
jgi:hypothetical protein